MNEPVSAFAHHHRRTLGPSLALSQGATLHGETLAALWRTGEANNRAQVLETFRGSGLYAFAMLLALAVELGELERDALLEGLCALLDTEHVPTPEPPVAVECEMPR